MWKKSLAGWWFGTFFIFPYIGFLSVAILAQAILAQAGPFWLKRVQSRGPFGAFGLGELHRCFLRPALELSCPSTLILGCTVLCLHWIGITLLASALPLSGLAPPFARALPFTGLASPYLLGIFAILFLCLLALSTGCLRPWNCVSSLFLQYNSNFRIFHWLSSTLELLGYLLICDSLHLAGLVLVDLFPLPPIATVFWVHAIWFATDFSSLTVRHCQSRQPIPRGDDPAGYVL